MKKVLIASGVAVLAFAMIASAASFNTNLTVGSTGADVVALQTALMNAGYNIPAIAAGTPKGYFGSQTQTAVKAYQAARSIPSTGFVGPLTRAALNGGAVAMTPVATGCPVGYTCTANVGTTPVVTTPGVITTPGMAGTLALTLQGSPSGATLDKGESEDIARYKLQASASDMQVTSLALDFDVRLWLYASSVVIKDDAGTVIASKSGLTQNDFTELTVGSSYRLYVPVSYVVPRAASKYFTVNVTMLPASDRCSTTCTLTLSNVQVRSVDGTGVTDTQTDGTDRTFSFTGTNSGQLVTTVNARRCG
jgi:peptidoglycan hydrolase-like protein with peptidoglycan-binding domain